MKNTNTKGIPAIVFICLFLAGPANAQDTPALTKKQEKYLSKPTVTTRMMGAGNFSSFGSYLYAANIAKIHTDNPEVANVKLRSLPDPDQKVSLRELFDEIAKQTSSTWAYDAASDYWLFLKPLSFEIGLAKGWTKQTRPGYMFYKPPMAPVGMDIYIVGRHDSTEAPNDARIRLAKQFAQPFTQGITADSMSEVSLPHQKALYYKTTNAKKGVNWRQWVVVDKGMCFVIVSAIKPDDETLILPDVEKMVQSFRVVDTRED